jgi:hypothetical protein
VLFAQVVGMRLGVGGQWSHDRSEVGVGVGEGRDGGTAAPRATATAERPHSPAHYRCDGRERPFRRCSAPSCRAGSP